MVVIKFPRLYVNGKFKSIIHPIRVSINLKLKPLSTAAMTLGKDEFLPARSYVELFTVWGSAGMFRVRKPTDSYGVENGSAELEHMIAETGDFLVKEKIKSMMAANTAVKKVFSHYKGGKWKLGTLTGLGSEKVAVDCEYDKVLDVMVSIMEQVPDCRMDFDFSTTPWTLKFVKLDETVTAQGRLSRNVESADISYDDTELGTRFWYQTDFKKKDGKITGTWVSKDASTIDKWGVIEQRISTSSEMTKEQINATVNAHIRAHKNPKVSATVKMVDLSLITNEKLDKLLVGKLLQLAFPDYDNFATSLYIVSASIPDVYRKPLNMDIGLGDDPDDVVSFLHNLDAKGSGGGGGGGKKKTYEERKWQEYYESKVENDYRLDITYNRANEAGDILEQAGLKLNSKRALIFAKEGKLIAQIKTQADKISLVVRGEGKDAKIDAASIVASVNKQEGSFVRIKAKTINLDGYVKATQLEAVRANISCLMSGDTVARALSATTVNTSILKVANTRATWKLANIPGYGFINYLGQ